ncbi:hypothetical protein ACFFX0_27930 [Citricoccus parietis]|uniref:Uncharacterized protein n=1 Tax=Citricoccus parietis TaxID=592307 RepID=A0ABV5G7E8_9MICC
MVKASIPPPRALGWERSTTAPEAPVEGPSSSCWAWPMLRSDGSQSCVAA